MAKSPKSYAATGGMSYSATGGMKCLRGPYHPNETLAKIIVQAWTDDAFKKNLLTFDEGTLPDWRHAVPAAKLGSTSKAFEAFDIWLDRPIVLTEEQLATFSEDQFATFIAQNGEYFFVLPDVPTSSRPSLGTAVVAMSMCTCGI